MRRAMYKMGLRGSFSKAWRVQQATILLALILTVAAALYLWAIGHGVPYLHRQDHTPVHDLVPTSAMRPGEMGKETCALVLPGNIQPGTYKINIGLNTGDDRMKIVGNGGESVTIDKSAVVSPWCFFSAVASKGGEGGADGW